MPILKKQAISHFLRSACERRLRLDLYPDEKAFQLERHAQDMPKEAQARPGLGALRIAGGEWEERKLDDLLYAFGASRVVGAPKVTPKGGIKFGPIALEGACETPVPGTFIAQAKYSVGAAFGAALWSSPSNPPLGFAGLQPDLIQVLPAGTHSQLALPDGSTVACGASDTRLQLRVIDIKLSAEPSGGYFAEIAYYSMALAGWLVDRGLDSKLAVSASGAVWPGSHDASALRRTKANAHAKALVASDAELLAALEEDLEPVPFDVFALRLRRFFLEDLPRVLSGDWKELPWHVDNRCIGCEYLGYPWFDAKTVDVRHCFPMAEANDHLSRVAFVSHGASEALREAQVPTTAELAQIPSEAKVFDSHHTLRATRTVVAGRAQALATGSATVPSDAGTSAVMPKWNDLAVYVSVDFDVGSGITLAFGVSAFWWIQQDKVPGKENHKAWKPRTFVVDQRSTDRERVQLLNFLAYLDDILTKAQELHASSTAQIYVWDRVQYEHLARVVGRHLQHILAADALRHLTWLFPPEQVVPSAEQTFRQSPVTVVRDVIRAVLAAPIPHYYSLLNVARRYYPPDTDPKWVEFKVQAIFEDPFSDQIPSERAHEIWTNTEEPGRPWHKQLQWLDWTVSTRLKALESVVRRLRIDLRNSLTQAAPAIKDLGPPERIPSAAVDGQLWYAFAKLDAALKTLSDHQTRAMPPHEREARFRSARLVKRLSGLEKSKALAAMALESVPGRWVFELSERSREVKLNEGDFNVAIAPEAQPGFLDATLARIANGMPLAALPKMQAPQYRRMETVCQVTVRAIDRERLLIAVDVNGWWRDTVNELEQLEVVDFSHDAILDPVPGDFFTKPLREVLGQIGAPPLAQANPLVPIALGQRVPKTAKKAKHTPVAEVLWGAAALAKSETTRDVGQARSCLETAGVRLNASQWNAWAEALAHRARLVWGPPGTGKSHTLTAVILGAFADAAARGVSLRVLLTAHTYRAIDEVLGRVTRELVSVGAPLASLGVAAARLRSPSKAEAPESMVGVADIEVQKRQPSDDATGLRAALTANTALYLVASTPQQVHNLLTMQGGPAVDGLFDLIVVDEASQMDVGHAVLALASLAPNGAVVVAGDPKQLPPISEAEPPLDLEWMVGSLYDYLKERHKVPEVMLETNYRSNETIVKFARIAGYGQALTARFPNLRLHLVSPLPSPAGGPPPGWPSFLHWTPEWTALLDPEIPAACFVYSDARSSQWNEFEAHATAALVRLLYGRLGSRPLNEIDADTGLTSFPAAQPYDDEGFWTKGVGVVTPHRAQQALTITLLKKAFSGTSVAESLIRNAVDTVERFQGQQRDVIVASFALGDPDAIGDESEFLLSLNRFNVLASRARTKLVVLVTQQVVDHIADDLDVLRGSRLLKTYVDGFCGDERKMTLGHIGEGGTRMVPGRYRQRK